MPPLVNQYIGTLVPAQTPFFIRPIVNMVFDKLNEMIYKPAIQAQVAIVRPSSLFSDVLCMKCRHGSLRSQINEHLGKNEWFAGGDGPTAADYMMIFPLEGLPRFGQSTHNIDAYVARVQKR